MAEKFDEAAGDENLLRLKDEAALLRVRQTELAERLGTGESEKAWERLADAWAEFEAASRAGNGEAMQFALATIGRLIKHGAGNDATWRDLVRLAHDRAAIVRAELDVAQRLSGILTPDQAQLIFHAMVAAVMQEVADPSIRSRISGRFAALIGTGAKVIDAVPISVSTEAPAA